MLYLAVRVLLIASALEIEAHFFCVQVRFCASPAT